MNKCIPREILQKKKWQLSIFLFSHTQYISKELRKSSPCAWNCPSNVVTFIGNPRVKIPKELKGMVDTVEVHKPIINTYVVDPNKGTFCSLRINLFSPTKFEI